MAKKKVTKNKKAKSKKPTIVRKPKVTSSMGPSYDTQMIVTILLLVFIYPVGLIFMWAWMKSWPIWLKIIISLPLIISLFTVMLILIAIGRFVRHVKYDQEFQDYRMRITPYQKNVEVSPTISPYKMY